MLVRIDDIEVGERHVRQVQGTCGLSGDERLLIIENAIAAAFDVDASAFGLDAAVTNLLLKQRQQLDAQIRLLHEGQVGTAVLHPHIFQGDAQAGPKGNAHLAFDGDRHAKGIGSRRLDARLVAADVDEENDSYRREQDHASQSANGKKQPPPCFRHAVHALKYEQGGPGQCVSARLKML